MTTHAFRIGARTDRKRKGDEIRLEARYDYGEADDVKNVDNAYAVGDYNYVFRRDLYMNIKAEFVTDDIADMLMSELSARGVAVVIEASHSCMTIRGIKKPGSTMVTSALRGLFRKDSRSRNEILSLLHQDRR